MNIFSIEKPFKSGDLIFERNPAIGNRYDYILIAKCIKRGKNLANYVYDCIFLNDKNKRFKLSHNYLDYVCVKLFRCNI